MNFPDEPSLRRHIGELVGLYAQRFGTPAPMASETFSSRAHVA